MIQRWAIKLVIGFIVRQIAKYGRTIDWKLVKLDAEARMRALMPGDILDDEAVSLCNLLIDGAEAAMKKAGSIETILFLASEQKWAEAFTALKTLVLSSWPLPWDDKTKALAAILSSEQITV